MRSRPLDANRDRAPDPVARPGHVDHHDLSRVTRAVVGGHGVADLRWLATDAGGGAGGGGYARFSPQPPYQAGLGLRDRRAAPDIAAHASLLPGWPVNLGKFWEPDGGTSAATPLAATGFAIVSARERAAGRPPLGPVNGLLYDVRATAPDLLFDVVEGDNGYTRTVPARHARPGYDLASGLGSPMANQIAVLLGAGG